MVIDYPRLILDNPVVVNEHCPGMFPQLSVWTYLRERYTSEKLLEDAVALMLKSWRWKTNKSCDSLFGRWSSWCSVTFSPNSLAKQSRQGKVVREFFFPSFPDNTRWCPVTTLRAYEQQMEIFRSGESKLFLATIKPHRAVSSSSIARWLKRLLEVAGVDTSIFSAHSVRGASSSTASNMVISTNDILNHILRTANWSSESVFYYKSTQDPTYSRAVLGSKI